MIKDGLWDAFHGYHMGQTAENIAARWQITREDQDKFAVASQNKAEAAQKAGKFAGEIAPVTIKGRKGDTVVDQDEYIRHGATLESVGGPAPGLQQGRHGHRGQRLGPQRRRRRAGADERRRGQEARAEAAGADRLLGPRRRRSGDHGHRPDPGQPQGLEKAGWTVGDLDLIESNEAFAAQSICVVATWASIRPR